jgi:hypothetical protein
LSDFRLSLQRDHRGGHPQRERLVLVSDLLEELRKGLLLRFDQRLLVILDGLRRRLPRPGRATSFPDVSASRLPTPRRAVSSWTSPMSARTCFWWCSTRPRGTARARFARAHLMELVEVDSKVALQALSLLWEDFFVLSMTPFELSVVRADVYNATEPPPVDDLFVVFDPVPLPDLRSVIRALLQRRAACGADLWRACRTSLAPHEPPRTDHQNRAAPVVLRRRDAAFCAACRDDRRRLGLHHVDEAPSAVAIAPRSVSRASHFSSVVTTTPSAR